jgi:hypothetical protein
LAAKSPTVELSWSRPIFNAKKISGQKSFQKPRNLNHQDTKPKNHQERTKAAIPFSGRPALLV